MKRTNIICFWVGFHIYYYGFVVLSVRFDGCFCAVRWHEAHIMECFDACKYHFYMFVCASLHKRYAFDRLLKSIAFMCTMQARFYLFEQTKSRHFYCAQFNSQTILATARSTHTQNSCCAM